MQVRAGRGCCACLLPAVRVLSKGGQSACLLQAAAHAATAAAARPRPEAAQGKRRGALARLRNAAVAHALRDEEAVLWVDADITAMPRHTLGALVDSGKDVVTTITKGCAFSARRCLARGARTACVHRLQPPDTAPGRHLPPV